MASVISDTLFRPISPPILTRRSRAQDSVSVSTIFPFLPMIFNINNLIPRVLFRSLLPHLPLHDPLYLFCPFILFRTPLFTMIFFLCFYVLLYFLSFIVFLPCGRGVVSRSN